MSRDGLTVYVASNHGVTGAHVFYRNGTDSQLCVASRRVASRRTLPRVDFLSQRAPSTDGDIFVATGADPAWSGVRSMLAMVKAELFPAEIRTLGVALPYAPANTIFGGTAEYAALLFNAKGIERGFYLYVTSAIPVSHVLYVRMGETKAARRFDASTPRPRPRWAHPARID